MKRLLDNKPVNGVPRGSVLFLVFCLLLFSFSTAQAFDARVKYVIDGDTFVLEDGRKVRIASIDTPEIGHDGRKDQYYARDSMAELDRLIRGRKVRLDYTRDKKDRYKRIVAWVYVDGMLVNEYMVRNGYAFFYYHPNNRQKFQNMLLQAQRKAYKENKGFWPVISRAGKFKQTWVGNRASRRCFPADDRYARKISWKNRVYFSDLGKAFEDGYSPARPVNFWPAVK